MQQASLTCLRVRNVTPGPESTHTFSQALHSQPDPLALHTLQRLCMSVLSSHCMYIAGMHQLGALHPLSIHLDDVLGVHFPLSLPCSISQVRTECTTWGNSIPRAQGPAKEARCGPMSFVIDFSPRLQATLQSTSVPALEDAFKQCDLTSCSGC